MKQKAMLQSLWDMARSGLGTEVKPSPDSVPDHDVAESDRARDRAIMDDSGIGDRASHDGGKASNTLDGGEYGY